MRIDEEIDPADQLGAGLDLLRTVTAALSPRDIGDKKTRQAIADTISHALETIQPVHDFLLTCRTIPPSPGPKFKK